MVDHTLTPITWANMDDVPFGARILYDNGRFGTLQSDPRYTDGKKCDGMSLHYIVSNYNSVFFAI